MMNRLLFGPALALSLAAAACGDSKPAKSPESNAGITETSAKEDMPPPKEETSAPAAETAPKAEPAGAAGGVITVAAMKLTAVKPTKTDKPVELKADGTVTIDGKPTAKIKGDQVDSTGGTSMVTVGVDGSLVGNGVKPGFKFEGDDLVGDGVKLSVGDDGTITSTKDGKSEPVVKVEGGAAAKRAALIVAVLYLSVPGNPNAEVASTAKEKKPAAAKKK